MSDKRLLIVYPYAFGTGWVGATPRILHVARGLSELGWKVELLRCKQPNEAQLKPVVDAFPGRVVTTAFNGLYPALFNRKGLRLLFRLWLRRFRGSEDRKLMDVEVERIIRFVREGSMVSKPDVIWVVTVGFLAAPIAVQRLSELLICPYVVEIQDPVPHPGRPQLTKEQRDLWESCLNKASLIITTTQGISKQVETSFPNVRERLRTVYLTYDDHAQLRPPQVKATPDRMVLLHAGLLYGGGGRNANTLIQGIAKAFERQSSVRGKLLLRLIGAGPGGDEALTQSRALGLGAAVELLPQMPQSECDREMARADVLVAIKFDDPQYDMQVPGKIFQYLAYGKPILGLMRETEAAAVLRRSGLGIVKANSDIDGIASALLELWNDHVSGLTRFQPNWEFIKTFSLSVTAKTLNTELLRLLQCEDDGPRSVRNDPGSSEPKSNFCPEMPKPS